MKIAQLCNYWQLAYDYQSITKLHLCNYVQLLMQILKFTIDFVIYNQFNYL